MVFFGAFGSSGVAKGPFSFGPKQIATICALWGVVISAVYMLRAYRQMFQGEPQSNTEATVDPCGSVRWPVILLLVALFIGGVWPSSYLRYIQPSVEAMVGK
jgi:NADH-quinone oxidoreductase subunit M